MHAGGKKGETVGVDNGAETVLHAVSGQNP